MICKTIRRNHGHVAKKNIQSIALRYELFVTVLEFVRLERFLPSLHGLPGCSPEDRAALARAFMAKAVFHLPTTRALIERLVVDRPLRCLCGWSRVEQLPSEATFSRAFSAFADSALPSRLHEALIDETLRDHLVGHVSRDSTAIEGCEKPTPKKKVPTKPKGRHGRPRKGEERPKQRRRLERQPEMTLPEMLEDLPRACDVGVKQSAKGHRESWVGYKLHLDVADGAIAVSCLLTSASLHDSQAAIPLATLTAARVTNLYDLMDSAYDAPEIRAHSESLGHVAIIDQGLLHFVQDGVYGVLGSGLGDVQFIGNAAGKVGFLHTRGLLLHGHESVWNPVEAFRA